VSCDSSGNEGSVAALADSAHRRVYVSSKGIDRTDQRFRAPHAGIRYDTGILINFSNSIVAQLPPEFFFTERVINVWNQLPSTVNFFYIWRVLDGLLRC